MLSVRIFESIADETGNGAFAAAAELREGLHEADWINSGAGLLVGFFSRFAGAAIRF
jgi:hypothetical protein